MTRSIPPVFGSVFHPEMPIAHYDGSAWQGTQWQGSDQLTLHPGAHVLHYGSACFEGLKAFRHHDGRVAIFRLDDHIARLCSSAERLYLPVPDAAQLHEMIVSLVARCVDIIPDAPGSLYLRPTLLGVDANVGKAGAPSASALLYVLASPVGDYFTPGTPLALWIETTHQRCAPHMGSVKSGANYASALHWQMVAKTQYHAQQVLFCPDGDVQETGASNFMVIDGDQLITKALSDEFLHGVTRRSVLQLAKDKGYTVREEALTVDALWAKVQAGAEAALTGTAAVIAPVTRLMNVDQSIDLVTHERFLALRQAVLGIQYGEMEDAHGWLTFVDQA